MLLFWFSVQWPVFSCTDLLTVLSDRIAGAFLNSGATGALAFDIPKAFGRVWHAGLLLKLKSYGIKGWVFGLISSVLSSRWLCMIGWAAFARISS